MSYFKNATVTVAELYAAAREVCSRLHVALGGSPLDVWEVKPYPGTAALSRRVPYEGCAYALWRLHMPAMPMDARLTRREADTIMAYVTHELGHALFTDYAAWDQAVKEGLAHLTNGLEDVRIERRLCALGEKLPGARELLAILTEHCVVKAQLQGWNPQDPKQLAFTLYQYGATAPDVLAYDVPSMPDFRTAVTPAQLAFMREVMRRVKACGNTWDVLDVARWLKAELANAPKDQPGQKGEPSEGDGKGEKAEGEKAAGEPSEGDGEPSEGEAAGEPSEGDGEPSEGDGEPSEGDGEPSEGEAAGEPSEGDGEPSEGGTGGKGAWSDADMTDAGQMATEPDLSDMGERVSERNGRDVKDVASENAGLTDFLNVLPSEPRGRNLYPSAAHTAAIAGKIGTPAKLRRDITRAVRAPDLMDSEHYQTRGRFDRRAHARVDAGALNVFRRRSEAPGQTAAVSLLLDLSSSMAGPEIEAAACLAVHLGDALKAANVPFEIAGFTHSSVSSRHGLVMAKAFRDPWPEARDRTAALTSCVKGGTAMLPGIKAMTDRLKARAGVTRRVLLVLTDGQDSFAASANRMAVKAAAAQGVEIVGMGIYYDAKAAFGPAYLTVSDLGTIARDGLKALVDVLREDGPRKRVA